MRAKLPSMEKINYLGLDLTRWSAGRSTFLAIPEKGALLMNWAVTLGDGSVRDVMYWPAPGNPPLPPHKVHGGNPILFPFGGRSFDRGDIHFWRDPSGTRRAIPIHGIARQGSYNVLTCDPRGFTAQFEPGTEAREAYPFDYEFRVTYLFEPLGLACELSLSNLGRDPIPWSPGHHFYFTLPWSEGSSRGDYLIRIPAGKRLKQDFKTGQLVPGPVLREEESVANPDLIDTIHTELYGNEAVFGEKGRPGDIAVRIGTDRKPPAGATFVTWTATETTPYYCVEPWMGPPNAPENKLGLHWVEPGKTDRFTVGVRLR